MKKISPWDIRSPVQNTNVVDVHIFGMAMEQSSTDKQPIDNSAVPAFTVHFILSGSGYAELYGRKQKIGADTLFVCFPRAKIIYYPDEKNPWYFGWITLDGFKVKDYLRRIGITESNPILELESDRQLRDLFCRAPYVIKENSEIDDIIALKFFYSILEHVSLIAPRKNEVSLKYDYKQYVANAIDFINNNYHNEELSLGMTAQAVGVSPKYLSMSFKKATNQTFINYVYNKRLSAALTLIDQGNISVTDISYRCGFSSPYYFSNQFKKFNRISPKQCILQRRETLSRRNKN